MEVPTSFHPHSALILQQQSNTCAALLTADQLAILQHVSQNNAHYKVAVYSGEISGRARTIVFLGETHVKDKANSDLGKQIIEKFGANGLEGADTSKTWGGKVLSVSLDALRVVFKVFSFGKVNQGSTIHDAASRGMSREMIEALKKVAEESNIAGLSKEEADKIQIKIGEVTIPGSRLLELIGALEVEANNGPLVFALEQGHQPDLAENIGSVALPGVLAACAYAVGSTICQVGSAVASGDGMGALETVGAIAGGLVIAEGMKRNLGKYDVMGFVTHYAIDLAFGRGRNRTMVSNVVTPTPAPAALGPSAI